MWGNYAVRYRHGAGLPSVHVVECAEGALSDLLAVGAQAGLQTHKLSLSPPFLFKDALRCRFHGAWARVCLSHYVKATVSGLGSCDCSVNAGERTDHFSACKNQTAPAPPSFPFCPSSFSGSVFHYTSHVL